MESETLIELNGANGTKSLIKLTTGDLVHLPCRIRESTADEVYAWIDVPGRKNPITTIISKCFLLTHNDKCVIETIISEVNRRASTVRILIPGEADPTLPSVPLNWVVENRLQNTLCRRSEKVRSLTRNDEKNDLTGSIAERIRAR